jgi:gluconokinase
MKPTPEPNHRTIVVMGVTGCGKTTVGEALAQALGWRFVDGDDHHPAPNVEKMRAGIPLHDGDREPWLDRLNEVIRDEHAQGRCVVLACSALRQRYRDRLARALPSVLFVHLAGSEALIGERLAARSHRYMPPTLLRSQFEALEAPTDAMALDVAAPVESLVAQIVARVRAPAADAGQVRTPG